MTNFGQETRFFVIFSVFPYFQALIWVANPNRNTTCYSVLESAEYEQQYSGQFVVIYSTRQKLLVKKKTNRGTWHKN
jgi:hypothetical protein